MNLIILGPQGSGKGTQAKLLAKKLKLKHISTGEQLRKEVAKNSEIGKLVKEDLEVGKLVNDDLLIKVLHQAIKRGGDGFILDGTPRNLYQAEILEEFLKDIDLKIDKVIFLDIPLEEGIKRLKIRAKVEKRKDDTPRSIRKRLKLYETQTIPVIKSFKKKGLLLKIDGTPDIATIHQDISQNLGI